VFGPANTNSFFPHAWQREIIPVETSIARLVKIIIHLDTSVTCYLWITTIDRRNRLTSLTIMAYVVASVFFFCVITFVTVCTEVVTTQERSHAGNHIVVVVVIVQVDLLIGCGSMVNDSVEMLSRYHYVDTERFLKDKRCIIQIQNKDDMCCARAIVTAMTYVAASVFFFGVIPL
jgi:hypothetical protein